MRLSEAEYDNILRQRAKKRAQHNQITQGVIKRQPSRRGKKRAVIVQSKKPPNQTELRFRREYLEPWLALKTIDEIGEHESINLNLANGCDYLTDWPVWKGSKLTIYEVKGPKQFDDAVVKLKVASRQFKRIDFYICKWDGEWRIQRVLP